MPNNVADKAKAAYVAGLLTGWLMQAGNDAVVAELGAASSLKAYRQIIMRVLTERLYDPKTLTALERWILAYTLADVDWTRFRQGLDVLLDMRGADV